MSHLGRVGENQGEATVHQNTCSLCSTLTMIKVGAVVLGLLLVGAGIAMYFLSVNAIAAYVTGGLGGAAILGVAIWSVVDCLKGKNGAKEVGVRELILDLSKVDANPKITEEEVAELLRNNPNLKKLRIELRPHSMDTNWDPDFKALDVHFKFNFGQSSGSWYIYDRK
jgi:hypothetical protein